MPARCSSFSGLVKGRSVAASRSTLYWNGVSRFFHAASDSRQPGSASGRLPGLAKSSGAPTIAPARAMPPIRVRRSIMIRGASYHVPPFFGEGRGARSVPLQLHLHAAIAVNEARVHPLGLRQHGHAQPSPLHFGNQRGELQFGDAGADAAVDAVTERQVAPRILAVDDGAVAGGQDALGAIPCTIT